MQRWSVVFVLAGLCSGLASAQEPVKFMGRNVAVIDPGTEDNDEFYPKGPASVCLEETPRQCYTMPDKFGKNPHVEVLEVRPGSPALFFSAESGGVSGWLVHFALLRPGTVKDLQNVFPFDASISNQNQHAFWADTELSDAKIFVTADDVWGPDEVHYGPHRYIISAYLMVPAPSSVEGTYYLRDRYMTPRAYDLEQEDILAAEKPEILARLARVKQQGAGVR